jgi:hypothetical protein
VCADDLAPQEQVALRLRRHRPERMRREPVAPGAAPEANSALRWRISPHAAIIGSHRRDLQPAAPRSRAATASGNAANSVES